MDYAEYNDAQAANASAAKAAAYAQMPGIAGQLNKAIQPKLLDKCMSDANEIAAGVAKAADFAESILSRLGGPDDECEKSGGDTAEPLGSLSKLNATQGTSLERLRRLFRALEKINGLV